MVVRAISVLKRRKELSIDRGIYDLCRTSIVPGYAFLHVAGICDEVIHSLGCRAIPGTQGGLHGCEKCPADPRRITVVKVIGLRIPDVSHRGVAIPNVNAFGRFAYPLGNGMAAAEDEIEPAQVESGDGPRIKREQIPVVPG